MAWQWTGDKPSPGPMVASREAVNTSYGFTHDHIAMSLNRGISGCLMSMDGTTWRADLLPRCIVQWFQSRCHGILPNVAALRHQNVEAFPSTKFPAQSPAMREARQCQDVRNVHWAWSSNDKCIQARKIYFKKCISWCFVSSDVLGHNSVTNYIHLLY